MPLFKRLSSKSLLVTLFILSATLAAQAKEMPEFPQVGEQAWLNSPPLSAADLRGSVVLLEIWTYDCWNCYRSLPWVNELHNRFAADGLRVIGIHAPEFEREKNRDNVVEKLGQFDVQYPVMMDNNMAYWRALNNRYWPTFYVVDAEGDIQGTFIGETHAGDAQAKKVESLIASLLADVNPKTKAHSD